MVELLFVSVNLLCIRLKLSDRESVEIDTLLEAHFCVILVFNGSRLYRIKMVGFQILSRGIFHEFQITRVVLYLSGSKLYFRMLRILYLRIMK